MPSVAETAVVGEDLRELQERKVLDESVLESSLTYSFPTHAGFSGPSASGWCGEAAVNHELQRRLLLRVQQGNPEYMHNQAPLLYTVKHLLGPP